jgi:hypothetical protein
MAISPQITAIWASKRIIALGFKNNANLCRKLCKNRRKLCKNRRKLAKIAENCDYNIDPM